MIASVISVHVSKVEDEHSEPTKDTKRLLNQCPQPPAFSFDRCHESEISSPRLELEPIGESRREAPARYAPKTYKLQAVGGSRFLESPTANGSQACPRKIKACNAVQLVDTGS
jgi:hypothetical protein